MSETIEQFEEKVSFYELINSMIIEIPSIQRDYAQGRRNTKVLNIRKDFLSNLIPTLLSSNGKEVVLDFIYGSEAINMGNPRFIPLDGQQRLTTLFLLHWILTPQSETNYLIYNENGTEFSRFSYKTRVSSSDFCNELVRNNFNDIKTFIDDEIKKINNEIDKINNEIHDLSNQDEEKSKSLFKDIDDLEKSKSKVTLSSIIIDQGWFAWNWRTDPTIQGMLVMLDALYERLPINDEVKMDLAWENITENKKIVFRLLNLKKFNLTDELYVKMNARGKELSDFDKFKSTIEEQIIKNKIGADIQSQWQENIDGVWFDLFWNKYIKPEIAKNGDLDENLVFVKEIEKLYFNFLKGLFVYYIIVNENIIEIRSNIVTEELLKALDRDCPFEIETNVDKFKIATLESKIKKYVVNRDSDIVKLFSLLQRVNFFNPSFF